MLKAVIVDNEKLVLDLLKWQLEETEKIKIVGEFTKPSIALKEIPFIQPDVVFLDIEMPGMNGIELGTKLLEINNKTDIVFVTAYDQYAIDAFKLNAIHYILKPADKESINETVQRILHNKSNFRDSVSSKRTRIELLGDIKILINEEEIRIKWTTVKVEELFSILMIYRNIGLEKWKIIELLWPQAIWEKGEQNLYSTIYRLKKIMNDEGIDATIENVKSRYFLHLNDISCDIDELDSIINKNLLTSDSMTTELQKVLTLYKGDLFGDRLYTWSEEIRDSYRTKINQYQKGYRGYGSEQKVFIP
ncbi:response regulator [Psychrobacillus sp. FSL H8-0483]|uniref:LytR/AlgR family response regulator transcription factor n=1 Tax=Psychrobacillus sp. FSL H8-0483 TaxID=2921389 RepID=UPI00315A29AB